MVLAQSTRFEPRWVPTVWVAFVLADLGRFLSCPTGKVCCPCPGEVSGTLSHEPVSIYFHGPWLYKLLYNIIIYI